MSEAIIGAVEPLCLVLPDVDVLLRCFTRRHPGLAAINQFQELVSQRRLCLIGAVRQELLSCCAQMAQMQRFAQQLAAFLDITMQRSDYELAAERRLLLREEAGRKGRKGSGPSAALITGSAAHPENVASYDNDAVEDRQLLLWGVAERIGADVWSYDASWQRLAALGCPLWAASKA